MNFDFEKYNVPFDHYIVDNFLPDDIAKSISNDFLDYENQKWHFYNNQIENKKALQDWGKFSKETYKIFQYFCSPIFVEKIKSSFEAKSIIDAWLSLNFSLQLDKFLSLFMLI